MLRIRPIVPIILGLGYGICAYSQTSTTPPTNQDSERSTPTPTPMPKDPTFNGIPTKIDNKTREDSFEAAVNAAYPLDAKQIRTFQRVDQEISKASAGANFPRPVTNSFRLNLDPGTAPHALRTIASQTSIIQFFDDEGNPWPIIGFSPANGAGKNAGFNIVDPTSKDGTPTGESNTLSITPQAAYSMGNLAVVLKGLKTAIVISLATNQKEVDYRTDLIVPGRSPSAGPSIYEGTNSGNQELLLDFSTGRIPKTAKAIKFKASDGLIEQAWEYQGKLWIKTPNTILSPAFTARAPSGPVNFTYALPLTPVIVIASNGKAKQLSVALSQ